MKRVVTQPTLNFPKAKRVFNVVPYNIGSLENFMLKRIDRSKLKN
jgi:hypothetical protein